MPARQHKDPVPAAARSAARLMAVQALYQRFVTDASSESVAAEFAQHRLAGGDLDGDTYAAADRGLFLAVVRGVSATTDELDALLDGVLAEGWNAARLEPLLREVMRCGAWELKTRPDVPARVAIAEYVDIAHAFYGGREPGMVNAVLDRLARQLRPGELDG